MTKIAEIAWIAKLAWIAKIAWIAKVAYKAWWLKKALRLCYTRLDSLQGFDSLGEANGETTKTKTKKTLFLRAPLVAIGAQ